VGILAFSNKKIAVITLFFSFFLFFLFLSGLRWHIRDGTIKRIISAARRVLVEVETNLHTQKNSRHFMSCMLKCPTSLRFLLPGHFISHGVLSSLKAYFEEKTHHRKKHVALISCTNN
jgi:hypothetical protein